MKSYNHKCIKDEGQSYIYIYIYIHIYICIGYIPVRVQYQIYLFQFCNRDIFEMIITTPTLIKHIMCEVWLSITNAASLQLSGPPGAI